ncbi:MAG TPA: excinuclease ABC subunit UvrC, partial [Terrimesophilobacter sp.]|nr:excinuclease ABC subunit UvrC [Terrimesophilobacter sp.]
AAAVQLFTVRGGRIRGVRAWVVDKELDLGLPELVETVLQNAYEQDLIPPKLVVVPQLPTDHDELQRWLTAKRGEHSLTGRTVLRVAKRGDLAALAGTAQQNASSALASYKTRRSSDFTARSQALSDIQDALQLDEAPLRMECFDVSHLGGTNIVASMVVFEDGLPRKDLYRRFSIPDATDDTDAIYQVLSRRLAHVDRDEQDDTDTAEAPARRRFAYRPQLLIVDGGQPQVNAAAKAMRDLAVEGIAVCGVAKRLEEIWLPESDHPVILPRNSDALFLIQRIRDEAHRFAIAYQRQKRKKDIGSQLDAIAGLGPVRVKQLLRHFGSVKRLREATVEQIAEVKGIGIAMASQIRDHLTRP